jgi:hypothetical protein
MNADEFENALRQFLANQPFQPFAVELIDGRLIEIARPKVVLGGGAASFFTPDYELIEFACEQTRSIRPLVPGATP